jgi:hypothetical protein
VPTHAVTGVLRVRVHGAEARAPRSSGRVAVGGAVRRNDGRRPLMPIHQGASREELVSTTSPDDARVHYALPGVVASPARPTSHQDASPPELTLRSARRRSTDS